MALLIQGFLMCYLKLLEGLFHISLKNVGLWIIIWMPKYSILILPKTFLSFLLVIAEILNPNYEEITNNNEKCLLL